MAPVFNYFSSSIFHFTFSALLSHSLLRCHCLQHVKLKQILMNRKVKQKNKSSTLKWTKKKSFFREREREKMKIPWNQDIFLFNSLPTRSTILALFRCTILLQTLLIIFCFVCNVSSLCYLLFLLCSVLLLLPYFSSIKCHTYTQSIENFSEWIFCFLLSIFLNLSLVSASYSSVIVVVVLYLIQLR